MKSTWCRNATILHSNLDALMEPFGRTDLRIGVSGAKNCKEPFSDVRFAIAPPKPSQNAEQTTFPDRETSPEIFPGVEK